MKIVVLTSSDYGTAAHHLPYILSNINHQVTMVVVSEGHLVNKRRHYWKKIKKIFDIGLLGAINGVRMRKWFSNDVSNMLQIESIKSICEKNNIPYHRVPRINSKDTKELFSISSADLGLSLGNPYIPKSVFSIPKFGMLNIHHEILPEYKNAQSIIWQIYNYSSKTGYTIHKIDSGIDTGSILLKNYVPIDFRKTLRATVSHTSCLLLKSSALGLVEVLNNFYHYNKNAQLQVGGRSYTTPSIWQFIRIFYNFKRMAKLYQQ